MLRADERISEGAVVGLMAATMLEYQIPAHKCHILAATDGSGCKTVDPIGYASVIAHRSPIKIKLLTGNAAFGGVQEAELRAVVDLVSYALRTRPSQYESGFYIQMFTDSSYVANGINNLDPLKVYRAKAHTHLWQSILAAKRRGVHVSAILLPRNTNKMMVAADALSKAARKLVVSLHDSNLLTNAEKVVTDEVKGC
jgi:ribonuclease HI